MAITKIKFFPRSKLTVKVRTGIAGSVVGGDGIDVTSAAGVFTVSVKDTLNGKTISSSPGVSITPTPNTTNQGLTITQTGPTTGSVQGSLDYNKITVTSGVRVLGATPSAELPWLDRVSTGFKVRQNIGANASGFQIPILAELWHTTPTTNLWLDGSCDFIAIASHAYSNAADGGALGMGAGFFASNFAAWVGPSATHTDVVSVNAECLAENGATIRNVIGVRAQRGAGAAGAPGGNGSVVDAAYTIVGSVAKWKDGIVLGDDISGSVVLSDNIMRAHTAFGCVDFFDLANVQASGSFLKFDTKVDWAGTGQLGITINSSAGNVNGVLLTNSHTGGIASFTAQNDLGGSGVADFGVRGTARASYGALVARDGYMYVNGTTGITIMADNATGKIKFATGGNTQRAEFTASGQLNLAMNSAAATDNGVLLINSNTGGVASFTAENDLSSANLADFGVRGSARASYGALVARDAYVYGNGTTGLTIMADNATGKIKFATGGNAQVAQISAAGGLSIGNATDPGAGNLSVTGTITSTSASASALTAGRQGATNPALQVDASTATSATGLKVKSAAAAGGLALSVITSGTNEALTIDAAGSGTITLGGTSTGNININRQTTIVINSITDSGNNITNSNSGGVASVTIHNDGAAIADFGKRGSARAAYGALIADDAYFYANGTTGITVMADNATGKIKFATGGNAQVAQIGAAGGFSVGAVVDAVGVINANVGFRAAGAAASGNVLRGDGTNFVSAQLSTADLTGVLTIAKGGTGTANGALILLGFAKAVNLNSVADTAITLAFPTGMTTFRISSIAINNNGTTASLTTARAGIFSAAGGGGTALAADQALSALTQNAVNTVGASMLMATNNTAYYNFTTVQFRVGTAQGAAATGDVYIYANPCP